MTLRYKHIYWIWLPLFFFLFGCEEEPIPVIPDPTPEPPITEVPPITGLPEGIYFTLKVSDVLLCPEEEISVSAVGGDLKPVDPKDLNFYLSPDIGSLDLTSGKYIAPSQVDQPITVELWAESKKDTSFKSGKILRILPHVPGSKVLTQFNGIIAAVDSKQLPDGTLIFASNNPAEPPGIFGNADFEILCSDQNGNLLWNTKLGKGTLRRIYVGNDAIYGLGYLNDVGFVVVKFDFQGKHIATKSLGIGFEMDFNLLENLKGSFNDQGDFFIAYGSLSLRMMLKMDGEMNLSSALPIPAHGLEFYSLENSKFLITSGPLDAGFVVTDSELKTLWKKSFGSGTSDVTRPIKTENGWEIWAIIHEYTTNSISLKKYDLSGNQIEDKKLQFQERLFFSDLHDIVQLPNGTIWFVASSRLYPSSKPLLNDESLFNFFHLIQISSEGNILKETTVESLNFNPPSFYGGWKMKYQSLFLGNEGLILAGQWYYNFLIKTNSQYNFSPC
jgi:hypothetical protein